MNYERKTVTIKIGDEGNEAVLVFEQLRDNEKARLNYLMKKAKDAKDDIEASSIVYEYRDLVLKRCQSVENLTVGGVPVAIEQIRDTTLYSELSQTIVNAYFTALRPTAEAEEKNATESA